MMNGQKRRRRRGVILTPQGLKKLQAGKAEAESCENPDKRYTLEALSFRTGLDPDTLMKVFAQRTGVDKRTLNRCFRAFNLLLEQSDYQLPEPNFNQEGSRGEIQNPHSQRGAWERAKIQNRTDWGEAPDVSVFYGRTEELAKLKHWILEERCRLVTLLGMGGMGKTCLSVKLIEQIHNEFEFVIWRSLRNALPIKDMLAKLIRFLSNDQETDLPETVHGKISRLIRYLREHRCLLVLDNAESILQGCAPQEASCNCYAGHYCDGHEGYGELLRRVGEARHQSCLVVTSREKPKEIALMEGETLPVRVMRLKGLQVVEAKEIFSAKGSFGGSPDEWSRLIEYYAGNPLALKIISTTIQKLFDGFIPQFLKHKTGVFGDIRNLLKQHFARLSEGEKNVITGIAMNRQPASFSELRDQILPALTPHKLLEALESLEERSLIEKKAALFFLQPVVMEYVTDHLIQKKITQLPPKVFSGDEYQRVATK